MHIKASTVIPAGVKITKCAPSEGKGKNIYSLLRAEERKLERQEEAKARAERVAALLKSGLTVLEAIKVVSKK